MKWPNRNQYKDMDEVRAANKRLGHYFFSPSTMRFFNSRVSNKLYGGCYFVTSEKYDDGTPRLYTVRRATEIGNIETMGEFQQWSTLQEAQTMAKYYANIDTWLRCTPAEAEVTKALDYQAKEGSQ